jgi:hypothetical protein
MNTKTLLAALGGAVASFLLGWLVYGILLMKTMEAHTIQYEGLMKTDMSATGMIGIFLSNFAMSWLLAYIFSKWSNTTTFSGGFMNGMLIALPILLTYNIGFATWFNLFSETWLVIDTIVSTLFWGVVGGVIAMILGMGKKAA